MAGVVLSPHPDDAVLSAWTTLRAGTDVRVCNACTAAPSPGTLSDFDRLFGVDDSAALVALRLAEDAEALDMAGITSVAALGFLDHQYRTAPIPADELRDALERGVDTADRICAPAGIGGHPDHVAVRDVALDFARRRGIAIELYADLPYAAHFGWPSWVTGLPARPYLVPDARWSSDLPHDVTLDRCAITLDADEVDRKTRALECYVTQYAALNAGPLDRIRHPEVIGFEVRWRVSFD